ncbi:MAG: hypothetical protein KAS87_06515 [Candidatus Omnitrophica bacterium]|nr:hypothetical protein [Candidatus Omnitrophota bacterium]
MAWINIDIGDKLHKKLKAKAVEEERDIKEVVREAIERYIEGGKRK